MPVAKIEPGRSYLDTNAFIEAIEGSGTVSHLLLDLLSGEAGPGRSLVTSELTLAELLVKPLALGRSDLVEAYEAAVASTRTLGVVEVGREILVAAARLRAEQKSLKMPDAIHVATAHRAGCSRFRSNDRQLANVRDLTVIPLEDPLLRALSAGARQDPSR